MRAYAISPGGVSDYVEVATAVPPIPGTSLSAQVTNKREVFPLWERRAKNNDFHRNPTDQVFGLHSLVLIIPHLPLPGLRWVLV